MNSSRATHIVLYDDQCPLCTFQMRVVTWLDWFNTVSLLPVSHSRAAIIAPSITREALLEAIHCVARDGRIYRGARCLRFIGLRMPLGAPLALILWFPGVIWIAERIYAWVSRNRHLLSRLFGCKEACAILPTRRRTNEEEIGIK
jgi:predicted DCC family thiol-disulfide oxidoreductase YuxK